MRSTVDKLVKDSITLEYWLPNNKIGIDRSAFSTMRDACFKKDYDDTITKIIYNNIVEYAINEYHINYNDISTEQLRALATSVRYDEEANKTTKRRFGFFGEVLLYSILYSKFNSNVLISKGYFYSPLEKSESKGYDAYHIIQRNEKVELWLGEAKFYINYKKPIHDVISKLKTTMSEGYFKRNVLAIAKEYINISHGKEIVDKLKPIIETWKQKVSIVISDELKQHDITLVYPIMIAFQQKRTIDYHGGIAECISYIQELFDSGSFEIDFELDAKLFFIFLPVDDVTKVKETVLEWIAIKAPLIL